MPALEQIKVEFHDYLSMVDAFRAIKDHIAISNADLDALCQFGEGHTDKLLGPTSARGFARDSLDAMIWALAIKGTFTIDLERARTLADHWEKRCAANTRVKPNRISKAIVERAKPIVYRIAGSKGGIKRAANLPAKLRSKIARKGGKSRMRKITKAERSAMAKKGWQTRRNRLIALSKPSANVSRSKSDEIGSRSCFAIYTKPLSIAG